MTATELVCPHCGYDFPEARGVKLEKQKGFAYSPLSDLALVVSMAAAGLGACGAVFGTIAALLQGEILYGLFVGPIVILLQIGMLVVFLQVQQ